MNKWQGHTLGDIMHNTIMHNTNTKGAYKKLQGGTIYDIMYNTTTKGA